LKVERASGLRDEREDRLLALRVAAPPWIDGAYRSSRPASTSRAGICPEPIQLDA